MDSFRDTPRNININNIKKNTKYYTFNYNIPIANWQNKFLIIKISDFIKLAEKSNYIFDYNTYEQLIIESSGVNLNKIDNIKSSLLIKHPSKIKNIDSNIIIPSSYNHSIEASLLNYKGKIIIGETMVLIFLFHINYDKSKIILHLNQADYINLSCLHPFFEKCEKVIRN
jgi:hypothetical protein